LLLKVNILEDPCFKKEGSNILSNLSLTISEAVLGARKTIPTIWGDTEVYWRVFLRFQG
jgi:DnaJ-class molecular chaperone